jgi:hypothetical protein
MATRIGGMGTMLCVELDRTVVSRVGDIESQPPSTMNGKGMKRIYDASGWMCLSWSTHGSEKMLLFNPLSLPGFAYHQIGIQNWKSLKESEKALKHSQSSLGVTDANDVEPKGVNE